MRNTKIQAILVVFLLGAFRLPSFGQQPKVLDWLPADDETARLDPGNYHAGLLYHTFGNGGGIQVDIKAERPVTIFLAAEGEWNVAIQQPEHPEFIGSLHQRCLQEHVVEVRYTCFLPPEPFKLIIRDDRHNPESRVFAGLGEVLDPKDKTERRIDQGIAAAAVEQRPMARRFNAPNDVHIQYYRWDCVQNCVQPEIQWVSQVKEKYELTSFLKVYGGFAADHDGERVSIRIKSPAPMLVAMLPADAANQLHARPEMLESALEKNACQQRGVQSQQFECTFNLGDGPQSLIVVPEPGTDVPHKKKAEIEMLAAKCVANCQLLESKR
jgi:hypothetical protein